MASIEGMILKCFLIIIAFHAHSTAEAETCGKKLTGNSGFFTSPNYPGNYSVNLECTWFIHVGSNQIVKLDFTDLQLEISSNCIKDYILIYDGPSRASPQIAKSCTSANHIFKSSSNVMTIYFKSNKLITARGFTANYKSRPLKNFEPSCGGTLVGNDGSFTSPNYPNMYPDNADCTWYIRVRNGQKILLKFTDINMENEADCRFDHIEIYMGPSRNSPLIGLTCTIQDYEYLINSNTLTVHLTTDRSVNKRGFSANFHTIPGGKYCGGILEGNSGMFSTPNYPENYANNVECTWHIHVQNGKSITLNLGLLRLKTAGTCMSDYVEIYDGPSNKSQLMSRVCHSGYLIFQSTTNYMTVYFRSDYSGSSDGFKASYTIRT